jgi:hypothetical protein
MKFSEKARVNEYLSNDYFSLIFYRMLKACLGEILGLVLRPFFVRTVLIIGRSLFILTDTFLFFGWYTYSSHGPTRLTY